MARLKNNHLGIVTGRVGDIIFKNRKGTPYICAPAVNYKKPGTAAAVFSRKSFGITSSLFSALGKIYYIKSMWDSCEISKGNYVNKMKLFNKGKVDTNLDFTSLSFAPFEDSFRINLLSAELLGQTISTVISLPPASKEMLAFSKCSAQGVVHCKVTNATGEEQHSFFPVCSDDVPCSEDAPMEFNLFIQSSDIQLIMEADVKCCYFNLIIKNSAGSPYRSSSVVKSEL